MDRLRGKVALVTGSSRGIGAAIAKRLSADGATVAITYVANEAAAARTVAAMSEDGAQAFALCADAADPAAAAAAIDRAMQRLGGLDILVHAAGIAGVAPLPETDLAEHRRQFVVNVDAVFAITKTVVPRLPDGGRIIIVG